MKLANLGSGIIIGLIAVTFSETSALAIAAPAPSAAPAPLAGAGLISLAFAAGFGGAFTLYKMLRNGRMRN